MTKKSVSKWLPLATASILGQPPRQYAENNPQNQPGSHAPALEFIQQRSSVA